MVRALLFNDSRYFKHFFKGEKDHRKMEAFMQNFECQKLIEELVF